MKDHLPALDGLRGIAVLLVLMAHLPVHQGPRWLGWIGLHLQPGYMGVDLFFVLSGFLITRILLFDQARGWPLRYFLARRCLRIFPIFYLTVGVMALLRPGPDLPWVATYLSNFYYAEHGLSGPLAHTWSLSVEEHYYLVWPALVYWLSPRVARRVALFLLVPAAALCAVWIVREYPLLEARAMVQVLTPTRMLSLAAGSIIAWHELRLRARPGWAALGALFVGGSGYALVHQSAVRPDFFPWFPALWLVGFAALSSGLVVLGIVTSGKRNPLALVLSAGPLPVVGKISYGLYLYHLPIFVGLGVYGMQAKLEPPSLERCALAVALALGLSAASYRLVERPILRLQRRFRLAERAPSKAASEPTPGPS
ncbi:MAG: acyltransferase [Planctomycetota bacterium]